VSKPYIAEIGLPEWDKCDDLTFHVQIFTRYDYLSTVAQLGLDHLLCWAADFDIERGMYAQALSRAKKSLEIFRTLVPEGDELIAATWMYGKLQYYESRSEKDIIEAAETLETARRISKYPGINYAESCFELALYTIASSIKRLALRWGNLAMNAGRI
jgi:hypothetical protein